MDLEILEKQNHRTALGNASFDCPILAKQLVKLNMWFQVTALPVSVMLAAFSEATIVVSIVADFSYSKSSCFLLFSWTIST